MIAFIGVPLNASDALETEIAAFVLGLTLVISYFSNSQQIFSFYNRTDRYLMDSSPLTHALLDVANLAM